MLADYTKRRKCANKMSVVVLLGVLEITMHKQIIMYAKVMMVNLLILLQLWL